MANRRESVARKPGSKAQPQGAPEGYEVWRVLNPEWAEQFEDFRRRNQAMTFEDAWLAFEESRLKQGKRKG